MLSKKTSPQTFFNRNQLIFFICITCLGIILRWYGLDERPLHHDESLNAIYGRYFYEDPKTEFYRYDPLLHGPFLYHLLPFVYHFLGFSKFAIRFIPALLGSLFVFLPFLFRRYFSVKAVLLLTTFISLSPSLIYWSRFLRHDFLIIAALFICLAAITIVKDRFFKPLLFGVGFALAFCIKENSYLTLAIILGFLIFDAFFSRYQLKDKNFYFKQLLQNLKEAKYSLPFALGMSFLIYIYFYSAGFQYEQGVLDGLYRKSIIYWFEQHSIERISGPFSFHLFSLSWYEQFFVLGIFAHIIYFYKNCSNWYRLSLFFILCFSLASHIKANLHPIESSFIASWLKLKLSIDFYPALFLILHSFHVTIYHLNQKKRASAFWGYFFFATFFTYSYVGEKVPWLSMYPLITGFIYLTFYFQDNEIITHLTNWYFPKTRISIGHTLLYLMIVFNLRMAVMTNFTKAGSDKEFISQVHTTKVYEEIALKVKNNMEVPFHGHYPKVRSIAENLWPLSWYLKGEMNYHFHRDQQDLAKYDYIFHRSYDPYIESKLKKTHNKKIIPLRHWWLPDYEKMTWLNFLNYSFTHNPWNSSGSSDVAFFTKKEVTSPESQNGP